MYKCVLFLLACSVLVNGQSTQVSQCTQNGGELPINTEVVGCAAPPCQLPSLQDVVLNIVFRAPKTMRSIRTVVTAYMSLGFITVPIPYDLQEASYTCNFLTNTYCPAMQGEVIQYRLAMFIEPTFPVGTATTLEFRLNDESDGTPFVCIRLPVQITAPISNNVISMRNETLSQ